MAIDVTVNISALTTQGKSYRICRRCIMDTSDPDIVFDERGVCSHCHRYEQMLSVESYVKKRQSGALDEIVRVIKQAGKNKRYDCIIGVSGGVDSTYTAYLVKKLGLRPLAVHLDNGWDSELAVSNIEKVLKNLDIDLYTYVLDWDEFKDLQLAFLKSSTPDSEIPTDHAILAVLYKVAAEEHVRYIINGHNMATEGGGVAAWSQGHGDWRYIESVHAQFGVRPIKSFVHYGILSFIYYSIIRGIRWIPLLDYLDYDKVEALDVLENELGWRYYGGKHYESIYTRFYQGFILPTKFGFNKKRLHLASLIWSGQMSRETALEEMDKVDYPVELQEQDKQYVIKKLGISAEEFGQIMQMPPKSFWDYPSYKRILGKSRLLMQVYHSLKRS